MGAEALQGTPCYENRTLKGRQHMLTLEASDIFTCLNIHLLAPWILKRTTTLPQTSDCLLSLVLDLTLSPPNTAVHVNEAPFCPGSLYPDGSAHVLQLWLPPVTPAPLLTWEEVLHLAKHSSKWSSTAMKRFWKAMAARLRKRSRRSCYGNKAFSIGSN